MKKYSKVKTMDPTDFVALKENLKKKMNSKPTCSNLNFHYGTMPDFFFPLSHVYSIPNLMGGKDGFFVFNQATELLFFFITTYTSPQCIISFSGSLAAI